MAEKIVFEQEVKGDLSELQDAEKHFDALTDALDDTEKETKGLGRSADQTKRSLSDMAKSARGMGGGLRNIVSSGAVGFFTALAGAIAGTVAVGNNWVREVDKMSLRMGISSERASVLGAGFELAGLSIEEAEAAISSFQGRLIPELEAEAAAKKEILKFDKQRIDAIKEMGKAEQDHVETLAELESQRSEINEAGIAERVAERNEELAELEKDYGRTLEDLKDQERRETERFKEVWADRAKEYKRSFLDAREDFEDQSRGARNFREFEEARQQFEKTKRELQDNLNEDNRKHETAHERRLSDLEESRVRERELFDERSADIAEAADKDVAKMQEANAKALADLDERIAEEKEAYADSVAAHQEQLQAISEAQNEAAEAGGGLTFTMNELGVSLKDAEGNLRPIDDIVWDINEALGNMEDGAKRAAIISELGWEDIAPLTTIDRMEALNAAQATGVIVSDEQIQRNREMIKQFGLLELNTIGAALAVDEASGATESLTSITEALNDVLQRMNEAGIFAAIGGGIKWMADQASAAWQMIIDLRDIIDETLTLIKEKVGEDGFLPTVLGVSGLSTGSLLGSVGDAFGDLLGFENGGIVPGVGPKLVVAHGGERITPAAESAGIRGGGNGNNATFNFNAPIYGVDDLQATIRQAMQQSDTMQPMIGVS